MKIFRSIDELQAAVGTHLGYSDWMTVDQARVDAFADATDDHQWIHVDAERAASGPYGTTIAHGFLTLSLLALFGWQIYRTEGMAMDINYGLNKVRFPSPALVPCRLRAGMQLVSVEPSGPGLMVTVKAVIEAEGGDKPVCVADSLAFLVPA